MKKRVLSLLTVAAMAATMFAGCTKDSTSTNAGKDNSAAGDTATKAEDGAAAELPEDTGKVLNIQVWNDEFKSRVENHYEGYEKVDETHGKIGDVEVVWTITANEGNAYQNHLDELLTNQESASADDKVDIFLVEADYALKYVNSPVSMTMSDLGITDADLSDQYTYTQDIVKDENGKIKGSSWQACSAGFIYNRDIAKEVLGSEEPEDVQAAMSDWDKYNETAKKIVDGGYKMCSVNDTYRVYSNNVSGKWVNDKNEVVVDKNIDKWVDDSKKLVDEGAETTTDLWSDDWSKGKRASGKIFGYFGPAWFFNFCLDADKEGTVAADGRWGFVEGPQSYFWGGTWMCAAAGTDNANLVKDLILTMTTDKKVLKEIAMDDQDCVNSKEVLADLAGSDDGKIELLGGQNPYEQLAAGAEKIDLSNLSEYDQGCNEEFQKAMKNYFEGNADKDKALEQFNKAVKEKYPILK